MTTKKAQPAKAQPTRKAQPAEPSEPATTALGVETGETRAEAMAECNVPQCGREPETNGVCGAHYATHRGYATKARNP